MNKIIEIKEGKIVSKSEKKEYNHMFIDTKKDSNY